jgi:hypothetical protein
MASPKKVVAKSAAKLKRVGNEPDTLRLETGIPLPERGIRDPEFVKQVSDLLGQIKPRQSFVVPKVKLHTVKKLIKTNHGNLLMKSALIKPEERFARIWRVK